MDGSPIVRHVERFFEEIGTSTMGDITRKGKNLRGVGIGQGFGRKIELTRKNDPSTSLPAEEGCLVLLRIKQPIELVVTTWTRETPDSDPVRGPDTFFPLTSRPELIGEFMLSRFPDLP